jgi:hypothetical protein
MATKNWPKKTGSDSWPKKNWPKKKPIQIAEPKKNWPKKMAQVGLAHGR